MSEKLQRKNGILSSVSNRRGWLAAAAGAVTQLAAGVALAQQPGHYFQDSRLPLGAVAQGQLARFSHLRGYMQPVEFTAPKGATISVVENGAFGPLEPAPLKVGFQIGPVYRLKVTNIPLRQGAEVFPSVELVNRLHPPEGQRVRFPVPIDFTQEELELALDGNYVTRVVYLEHQSNAYPAVDGRREQRVTDVGRRQDPLEAADKYGRPMAIIRIGSRVPQLHSPNPAFTLGSPPIERYPAEPQAAPQQGDAARRGLEPRAVGRHPRLPVQPAPPYPRLPLGPGGPGVPSTAPLLGQPLPNRVRR